MLFPLILRALAHARIDLHMGQLLFQITTKIYCFDQSWKSFQFIHLPASKAEQYFNSMHHEVPRHREEKWLNTLVDCSLP